MGLTQRFRFKGRHFGVGVKHIQQKIKGWLKKLLENNPSQMSKAQTSHFDRVESLGGGNSGVRSICNYYRDDSQVKSDSRQRTSQYKDGELRLEGNSCRRTSILNGLHATEQGSSKACRLFQKTPSAISLLISSEPPPSPYLAQNSCIHHLVLKKLNSVLASISVNLRPVLLTINWKTLTDKKSQNLSSTR
ncbi:uncharacterized protein UTRI_04043 [Ustilago trichophora]|uniref:Uncharacterized protein n=1 Tax=Ustilago trichophora TaxID=86804 RepID=A0A5C3E6V5_9BASI|nr:uncharacterized protein UTRI_04043 [Ustilago trichophora]